MKANERLESWLDLGGDIYTEGDERADLLARALELCVRTLEALPELRGNNSRTKAELYALEIAKTVLANNGYEGGVWVAK